MIRTLLLTMAWLAMAGHALADELRVSDFSIRPDETKTIAVELNNPNKTYIALEFYMTLPKGISIVSDDDGYFDAVLNSERSARHTLEVKQSTNGSYHFLCYSSKNNAIKGTEGEIVSMTIKADDGLEGGQLQQGRIFAQKLSDDSENKVTFPDFTFGIDIEGENVNTPVSITIPMAGVTTYRCVQGLDFSGVMDFKAYIIAGYDRDEKTVYTMPVTHVPAGTGLYLVGEPGTYTVPITTHHSNYSNMLVGVQNATSIPSTEGAYTNLTLSTEGASPQFVAATNNTALAANKAYLQLPTALYDGSPVSIKCDDAKEGDLNKDGRVNVTDVMILVRMCLDQ